MAAGLGKDADEFLYAWSIIKDVNEIAAADEAQYALPLYVNVATRNPINGTVGSYPSGGAVDGVPPIWKATEPAIDNYGIDLYDASYPVYTKLLDLYHRPDNAMFVPENRERHALCAISTLHGDTTLSVTPSSEWTRAATQTSPWAPQRWMAKPSRPSH